MRKLFRHILLTGCILVLGSLFTGLYAQSTFESAQSGNYSDGSTWVGGQAPGDNQGILIKSGHTVTLDRGTSWIDYIQVWNVTIEAGAVLNNNGWPLWMRSTGSPTYKNDGIHNGPGTIQAWEDGNGRIDGNGSTNLDIEYDQQGRLQVRYTCNLTINGDIKPTQYGFAPATASQPRINYEVFEGVVGTLTVNGDIYGSGILLRPSTIVIPVEGTLIVNGNISFNATSDQITNNGTLIISGNVTLGATSSSYLWNNQILVTDPQPTLEIGGDLLGGGLSAFRNSRGAHVKFGGQVFPAGGTLSLLSPTDLTTVEYNGTTAQVVKPFGAVAYRNLIISNTNAVASIEAAVTANTSLVIKPGAALTVSSGSLTIGAAATFTIESDATGTGSFISNSTPNANVKRYIAGHNTNANDGWHFLSSPVASQAISAFHTPGSGDFYKWDETTNTWINRTAPGGGLNVSFEPDFVPGRGYMIANNTTDTKTFTGSINASNLDVTGLTYTGSSSYAGWQLLGNPFSSAISWNNGTWALNNVDANAQIWNEANASYTVVLPNEVIPSMNGFMVHASQNNASLTIPASARLHSNVAWYKSANNTERIVLTAFDAEGQTAQSTIIRFDGSATDGYDNNYDSHFLAGLAPMFYSISQDYKLALNTLPQLAGASSIPLGFVKNSSTAFSIELTENIPGQAVYLTDLKTNETVNLTETNYSYGSSEGDDVNRFLLHFSLLGLDEPGTADGLKAWVYDGQLYLLSPEPGDVSIYDIRGRKLSGFRSDTSDLQSHPLNSPSGVYIISFQGRASVKTAKVIVQ